MATHKTGARTELRARLPFGTPAARDARRLVGELLADHAPSRRLLDDAMLVVHELVVNGVTHGRPNPHDEIEVYCSLTATELVISVLDQGSAGTVAVRPPSRSLPSGRGLAIVDALSRSWSVDRSHGTRVSAVLPV